MSDEDIAERAMLDRVFAIVPALVGTVLSWVRRLAVIALLLAFVDVGLFLLPRRDEPRFVAGALVLLALALLPAIALNRLAARFVAFRDGMVTIRQRLPELTTLPRSTFDGFAEVAPSLETTAGKRLPGRLIGTTRVFVKITKLVRSIVDRHKELFSASTTVIAYGPRDVLLAVYGLLGTLGLALAMPAFGLYAVLAS